MGASQSKKRRKDKKKRTSEFVLPRSASADVIRSLGVSTSAFPPLCHQPPDPFVPHHTSLTALGVQELPRSFYHSLEGIPHSSHNYSDPRRARIQDASYYECKDLPSNYNSSSAFRNVSSALYAESHLNNISKEDLNDFTFSGNGQVYPPCQDFQSDFVIESDEKESQMMEDSSFLATSTTRYNDIDQSRSDNATYLQTRRRPDNGQVCNESVLQSESNALQRESDCYVNTTNKENNNHCVRKPKISLNALEDEILMTARYEEQKKMAQQLRILRKHIHDHESQNMIPPTPLLYGDKERELKTTKEDFAFSEQISSESDSLNAAKISVSDLKTCRKRPRNKFTKMSNYKNLDSHPVMSKLQNEQNNRLEDMERRMKQIKMSAMQEADRRRFAEIFPAKANDDHAERMIQEARDTLDILKEKHKDKEIQQRQELDIELRLELPRNSNVSASSRDKCVDNLEISNHNDLGEVIPVHVSSLSDGGGSHSPEPPMGVKSQELHQNNEEVRRKSKSVDGLWDFVDLGRPMTWIWLPFLVFPLMLRVILSFIFKTSENSRKSSLQQQRDFNVTKEKTK